MIRCMLRRKDCSAHVVGFLSRSVCVRYHNVLPRNCIRCSVSHPVPLIKKCVRACVLPQRSSKPQNFFRRSRATRPSNAMLSLHRFRRPHKVSASLVNCGRSLTDLKLVVLHTPICRPHAGGTHHRHTPYFAVWCNYPRKQRTTSYLSVCA